MKFILGTKREMTQRYDDAGAVQPVTIVQAGPCTVTQVNTGKEGAVSSVQVGYGEKKKISKPLRGHLKGLPSFRYLKEFRVEDASSVQRGQQVSVGTFKPGDVVQVTAASKGKGFQGVVKRHGFHGSPKTHGHKDQLRMPGSIGSTNPARVFKGMRMAGRMGGGRTTVKNLVVIDIDEQENFLYLRGAVPGARNGLVLIAGEGDLVLMSDANTSDETVPEEQPKETSTEEKAPAEEAKNEKKGNG